MKQIRVSLRHINAILYSLILLARIQLSSGWFFIATSADQDSAQPTKQSPYYRGTVNEEGVTYEYEYANGKEVLHVLGKLPNNFDQEKVMETFRTNLGVDGSTPKNGVQSHSIFDSFSAYLSDVKHTLYNNLSPSSEIDEQISIAREELIEIDDELSRVLTQQLVLRKRQADLGIYIERTLKAKAEDRNPTVEELVLTEDDRLTLVEHRLKRMKEKLLKQKEQIENFLKYHENDHVKSNEHPPERHIFTNDYEPALSVRVIANDESNSKK